MPTPITLDVGPRSPRLPAFDASQLEFEVHTRRKRDLLRLALLVGLDSLAEGWRFVTRLGFLPRTSVRDKLPYHRAALSRPHTVRLGRPLEWQLAVGAAQAEQGAPARSRPPRPRPRYWVRDSLNRHPFAAVVAVNTALAYLMFQADVKTQRF